MASKKVPRLLEHIKPSLKIRPRNDKQPKLMENICREHKLISVPTSKSNSITVPGGERSYMLIGSLARLEKALLSWTMNQLIKKHDFQPVVVPNILHGDLIERCGFPIKLDRTQVYKIAGSNLESMYDTKDGSLSQGFDLNPTCIAGTSEFALVAKHIGDIIDSQELPKRYCALSTCYRAETSDHSSESGIYRVHFFKKVEMVALTDPESSDQVHDEFLSIQKSLFDQLNLEYQVLDMPEDDLGLSAKKKYDIEAWMPGRGKFGEISSTSNCGDYQSSRLNIKYQSLVEKGDQLDVLVDHVHTVNGTACSSIRTLIALVEQHQTDDGDVILPDCLVPYMDGDKKIPTDRDRTLLASLNLEQTESSRD